MTLPDQQVKEALRRLEDVFHGFPADELKHPNFFRRFETAVLFPLGLQIVADQRGIYETCIKEIE